MDKFLSYLGEKRAKLQKQIAKLQHDLSEVDKAERLYRESGAVDAQAEIPLLDPRAPSGGEPLPAPADGTIKQRVVAVLDRNPSGLTSGQILNVLRIGGLPNLQRESLSPQLTRLKNDGEISLDSSTSLWTRVQKHEGQGA